MPGAGVFLFNSGLARGPEDSHRSPIFLFVGILLAGWATPYVVDVMDALATCSRKREHGTGRFAMTIKRESRRHQGFGRELDSTELAEVSRTGTTFPDMLTQA